MQQPQSVCAVQRLGSNAKTLEVVENIRLILKSSKTL